MKLFSGQIASVGFVIGPALVLQEHEKQALELKQSGTLEAELLLFTDALEKAADDLRKIKETAEKQKRTLSIEILEAHLMLLEDPEAKDQTIAKIQLGQSAASAYYGVIEDFRKMFLQLDDELIRQRATDLHDIRTRVVFYIQKPHEKFPDLLLTSPSIVIARDLTPSQIFSIDKEKLLGFVTVEGSSTSHTAILARSLEIPAIVGLNAEVLNVKSGAEVGLNGELGQLFTEASEHDKVKFLQMKADFEQKRLLNTRLIGKKTQTLDGHEITLAANISGPQDLTSFTKNDAEAVGLYRTEFLFLDREQAPSEDEQFRVYRDVFNGVNGKPILIRTLDIGGDKKAPYLSMKHEENPFLGIRALRLCFHRPDIFKTQLRALIRAGHNANWGLMFPMVSNLEELVLAKSYVAEVCAELKNEKKDFSDKFQIGIMIEIPSAAWMIHALAPHVDFISIGTNDLLQYTCAADRLNPDLKSVYDPYNIGFLHQIHHILKTCSDKKVHSGICGSLSHHADLMPFFIGCGVDELSMTSQHILGTRAALLQLNQQKCKNLVQDILACSTTAEVKEKFRLFAL